MKSFFIKIAVSIAIFGFTACGDGQKGIKVIPNDLQRKVDVLYDGKLFTSYIYPNKKKKPSLYPIYTAKGTVITRGFPIDPRPNESPDHPHHVGAWLTSGDVNGIDFWGTSSAIPADEKPKYGYVRHREIISTGSGSDQGVLVVSADWVDYYEKLILKEETRFLFSGEGDWRIIERVTKLTAHQEPVVFGDTKEGMIAIRMDRAFEEPSNQPEVYLDAHGNPSTVKVINNEEVNGVYRNSEGLEKGSVWGKSTKWVCLSADKNGEKISVAIIDHKNNPGYPAHSHARGYGLFSTNNMGSKGFNENNPLFSLSLNPEQSITFKHLIVVKTNGFATDNEMNRLCDDFNK
jgi:hypothetical protein